MGVRCATPQWLPPLAPWNYTASALDNNVCNLIFPPYTCMNNIGVQAFYLLLLLLLFDNGKVLFQLEEDTRKPSPINSKGKKLQNQDTNNEN